MDLNSIRNSVQEVAEAIAAVLHVDVTIIDNEFKRIASTGKYKTLIGNKIPSKCLYEYVIKEKVPHYVERYSQKNGENIACNQCEAKDTCKEFATIGYPIINQDEVIGIIGINVFDENMCTNICSEFNSMTNFLNRLSSLLIGNIHHLENIEKLKIQKQETNHIMNSLNEGILCVDKYGVIKYVNDKGKKLLGIKENQDNINIKRIMKDFDISFLENTYKDLVMEVHNNENKSLLIKIKPIILQGETVSNIIQINKKSDEVRAAYKLFANTKQVKFEDIIGNSNAINKVKNIAKNIATTDSTVLLQGESGTGKELFARAIHQESNRFNAPFVAVNCASIPDNLLESEFFGYEGGTFTGARKEGHMGKFEVANGGTLFLDEIGDLPLHLQPKILRVLQEQSFTKIGGKEEVFVNVRIIAATNKNLEQMVKNGQFREDLYYRLNVIPIFLPSLKERDEDIFLLSEYLIKKYCCKYRFEEKKLSEDVKKIFESYKWPGNIRELENIIEYLINISRGDVINVENLPDAIKQYSKTSDKTNINLKVQVESYERSILEDMILKYGNEKDSKNIISKELGIDLSTLYRKLNKYNLQ